MIRINIYEAKTHLSRYLAELQKGEKILLCRRNQPVAEIRPIDGRPGSPRPIGLAKEIFRVPATFFEELPAETISMFNGEDPVNILLDTCTFLWIVADSPELTDKARRLFTDPNNDVYLSVASAWEIIVKHKLGRLPLPESPHEFILNWRTRHDIETLPLDEPSVLQLARLPEYHKDPFDRIIICQAIANSLVILTPDSHITKYPVRTEW